MVGKGAGVWANRVWGIFEGPGEGEVLCITMEEKIGK
jgi:hypothetical protein